MNNMVKPFFILALCLVFILGSLPLIAQAQYDYQNQIDDINSKIKNLETERKNIEKSIAAAKDEKQQEIVKRNHLDQQIKITKNEIDLLLERIGLLEQDIEYKINDITEKQRDIDKNYDEFLKRMRIMYMYDDTTMLGLLLGSDSFTTFLAQADSMSRVADYNQNLIHMLTAQRIGMENQKADLDSRLGALEADRDAAESLRLSLTGQLQAANLRIQDIDKMEKEFLADLEKNKAMVAAMESELKEIYRKIEWSKNPYIGGEMAWPVPGFYKITSEYGNRFGGRDFHTGMDIAGTGVYGANIVAANTGTVRYVNWAYSPGRGYGIYLIVDHGGGVSTLYAHCSNILVKVGDTVIKGDPIAKVGSTGWSTGPHLHFEVRVNGNAQNPKPYVIGR